MKISDFSKLSNTSTRMLRHYEELGLITVKRSENDNNYRDYSAKELQKVGQIKVLQDLGFSLRMIKEMMEKDSPIELESYFDIQKEQLEEQIKQTLYQQSLLKSVASILEEDKRYLDYHVLLKELPKRQVMSLRQVVSDYSKEQEMWQELYNVFLEQEVTFSEPSLGMSLYHDEAFEDNKIDLEIQSSIVGSYSDTETVTFKTVPEMTVVSTTFHGSFEQMPLVMEALAHWMEVNDLVIDGPMINIYHVTQAQDPNPDNWITESCLVVKPKEVH